MENDKICLENLRFRARHGVYDFEREQGQVFVLSTVLEVSTEKAGRSDDLEDTVNYAKVGTFLVDYLTRHTFRLLEAAAEHACRALLLRFPQIRGVELELKKPEAPMDLDFESVSVRIHRRWHRAYVALGANLGDREDTIRAALAELDSREEVRVLMTSDLIFTKPYGGVEQEDFLNGACEIETLYTPEGLLDALHEIENTHGRTREIHWGPRTLDLDILIYDNIIMYTENLKIPHPDMQNRGFVLRPMSQIAPWVVHPVLHKTMEQMASEWKEQWI